MRSILSVLQTFHKNGKLFKSYHIWNYIQARWRGKRKHSGAALGVILITESFDVLLSDYPMRDM